MRAALAFALVASLGTAEADTLAGHPVVLDGTGKLLSWAPQGTAYDALLRMAWLYFETRVPEQEGGLPGYITHSLFDGSSGRGGAALHAPAGLFAAFADGAVRWYAYSGDDAPAGLVRVMLDHQLTHGTTPPEAEWGSMPWSTSDPGQVDFGGASDPSSDGPGVLEPDKGGELGYAYLQIYELGGEARYFLAARAIADTLAGHVQPGDAEHSPLPFRVVAGSGEVRAPYTANFVGTLMLFDELERLQVGDVGAYRRARDLIWTWLLAYPFRDQLWSIVFEDAASDTRPADDPTQYIALKLAVYLLERPETDPVWRQHLQPILPWVEAHFATDTADERGVQYGANVISEQQGYMVKMANHTARYAAVSALWAERTGDHAARDKAFRSLNWSTYMVGDDGAVLTGPGPEGSGYWYQVSADWIRDVLTALGAAPSWAPPRQSHLVRSSSVVREVFYSANEIRYQTYLPDSIEVLRVAFRPAEITAGGEPLLERSDLGAPGYTIEDLGGGDYAVRIRHVASGQIVLIDPPVGVQVPPRGGGGGCAVAGGRAARLAGFGLLALVLLVARRRARS
jgi:hypothetical protein